MTKSFPVMLKTVFLEGSLPTDEISGLQGMGLKVTISQECTMKRRLYQSMVMLTKQLGLCNTEVYLLLSTGDQRRQGPSVSDIL